MVEKLMHSHGFVTRQTKARGAGFVRGISRRELRHVALFSQHARAIRSLDEPVTVFYYNDAWEMVCEEYHRSLRHFLESSGLLRQVPRSSAASPRPRAKRPFEPVHFIEMLETNPDV